MASPRIGLVALGLLVLANAAPSQTLGLNINSGGSSGFSTSDRTYGWQFSLSQPVTINRLGIWDLGGDGLNESHQVGIWNSGGTLVANVTVSAGTSATFVAANSGSSGWRFESIGDVVLPAGSYTIGAQFVSGSSGGDAFAHSATGLTNISELTLGQAMQSAASSGFSLPNSTSGLDPGMFGPNFAVVPEPGSMMLAGLAVCGAGAWLRRRVRPPAA